jgi:CDP-diacylglycerol--serine O-phosphatidyltransferase
VFSGKRVGTRVPPEMVGPAVVVAVLFIALLIAYPWIILTAGTLAYLGALPFGYLSYRRYERRTRDSRSEAAAAATPESAGATVSIVPAADNEDRPPRLN